MRYTLADGKTEAGEKGFAFSMAQIPTQAATIVCPNCGQQFTTQIRSIVDVGQDPEAKMRFLQGQLNVAICPRCGTAGPLNTPFLYHDPHKELLFVYTPPPTTMSHDQQQRFIGSMINAVMSSLPSEQRKGYLFQPRNFLSLETMLDEIIVADGIPREQLESQRRKLRLLNRLRSAVSDDVIEVIARENEKDLDYEFFLLLNNLVENMAAQGNEAEAVRLQGLRSKLLQYSEAARQGDAESAQILSQGDLLQLLLETEDEQQRKALVAAARPLLDYAFFQSFTGMIEKAQQDGKQKEADRLLGLRSQLLAWTDELDAAARKIWERKAKLIQDVLQSPDWRAALEPHWQEIDPIFLTIVSSNVRLAQDRGNEQAAATLQQLMDLALLIAHEHAPPEVQLLNQLLEVEAPTERQRLLEENREHLNAEFLALIDQVSRDLAAQRREEDIKALQMIRDRVEEMIEQ
jgi:hypothetical protein